MLLRCPCSAVTIRLYLNSLPCDQEANSTSTPFSSPLSLRLSLLRLPSLPSKAPPPSIIASNSPWMSEIGLMRYCSPSKNNVITRLFAYILQT
jgi:hypothetical protein